MQQYINPPIEKWAQLCQRPVLEQSHLELTLTAILKDVKTTGDAALLRYGREFDCPTLETLTVQKEEIEAAKNKVSTDLKNAIQQAANNLEKFHAAQIETPRQIETSEGVTCWRKNVAIEKVGLYIPGGTAPLFSTILMLGIPAKLAGCNERILCTPADKDGNIHPAILYTADLVGIDKIYKVGGAQAIAAMAYGTETIPQVYKIYGPGNQYVTKAKELVQQTGIAIDMPAGPSEVLIIADRTCRPDFVAADLLSQAEHGADSQVILLANDVQIIEKVQLELIQQLKLLPRKTIAKQALENSFTICFEDVQKCIEFSNQYAPEHLIIASTTALKYADDIKNAGSVFLGNYSCESAGDYASGTNHTLPTNGFARSYSGVSVDSFVKKITYQNLTQEGLRNIGKSIEIMAAAEGLDAHKNAVSIRLAEVSDASDSSEIEINTIIRKNIQNLEPYASARSEFSDATAIYLDANENPYGTLNRYPDPLQNDLRNRLSKLKNIAPEQIFISNGSDQFIDYAFRIFCDPRQDKALTFTPSFGMYEVAANVNDVELITLPLDADFQINTNTLKPYLKDKSIKVIFICSPNNPTGNSFSEEKIEWLLKNYSGIVIIDEAYIDFSSRTSWLAKLEQYPRLIVSQTFSKAWSLAGARVGSAYMSTELAAYFNKVKMPYNISALNAEAAINALSNTAVFTKRISSILSEKRKLQNALQELPFILQIHSSDANFFLIKVEDANAIYQYLRQQKVIVRNRSKLVENCLRISIGTPEENAQLLKALRKYSNTQNINSNSSKLIPTT